MEGSKDLTIGSAPKLIIAFYIPMFFTNLLQQVYSFADAAIVGEGLGDNGLAAVGNIGTLTFFTIGFSIGLGNGFAVVIAQHFGAKQYEKLKHAFAASVVLAAIMSIGLTAFSVSALGRVLVWLKTDSVIYDDSLTYGTILFSGLVTSILYNASAACLRALGDSKTPLTAIIASSILNIVLDYVFIFIIKTGVEGAALATIISQCVSALICVKKILTLDVLKVKRQHFHGNRREYGILLKNGIPMAIMNSLTAIGCMVVQFFVNGFGVNYTAAYSACSRYNNMFMQPAFTTGQAVSAFTSQNYGAKKFDRIKEGIAVGCIIAGITYVVLGGAMLLFARPLASILLNGEESIGLACEFFRICGVTLVAVDFLFVFRSAVQGMGFSFVPMMSGLFEMFLRVAVIVFFSSYVGFKATAFAESSAWIGALLVNLMAFLYYFKKVTAKKEMILKEEV